MNENIIGLTISRNIAVVLTPQSSLLVAVSMNNLSTVLITVIGFYDNLWWEFDEFFCLNEHSNCKLHPDAFKTSSATADYHAFLISSRGSFSVNFITLTYVHRTTFLPWSVMKHLHPCRNAGRLVPAIFFLNQRRSLSLNCFSLSFFRSACVRHQCLH